MFFSSYNGRVQTADVIVAGGGIIGLSAAREMARNGWRVRVLEKGRAMAEASWAGAGMLAAHDPDLAGLADFPARTLTEIGSPAFGASDKIQSAAL